MKKTLYLLLTVLLALAALGCEKKTEPGVIRYIALKVYDPVFVALEKGFFEKQGVTLQMTDLVTAGPTALQTIAGGSADACHSSFMATIAARSQGLPVIAVTDLQSAIGTQALEEFFVRRDSGINGVADLRGKTVAINLVKSSFHYTWLMALEKWGLAETDVDFIVLPFEQQELALANSRVDAIGLMQPYVLHAKENADLKVLYNALDVFGQKQFAAHVMNRIWAENNPALARGFVAAVVEAEAWIAENQQEAKAIIGRYTGIAPEYIEDYTFQKDAAVIMADAQYWLDYMLRRNEISAGWMTVGDFATNRYNPNF
jgi:NitT/TauT family transport system substrate-binding protein